MYHIWGDLSRGFLHFFSSLARWVSGSICHQSLHMQEVLQWYTLCPSPLDTDIISQNRLNCNMEYCTKTMPIPIWDLCILPAPGSFQQYFCRTCVHFQHRWPGAVEGAPALPFSTFFLAICDTPRESPLSHQREQRTSRIWSTLKALPVQFCLLGSSSSKRTSCAVWANSCLGVPYLTM